MSIKQKYKGVARKIVINTNIPDYTLRVKSRRRVKVRVA